LGHVRSIAPYIGRQLALSPSQSALLVAVPVLAAAIVRVSFGNVAGLIGLVLAVAAGLPVPGKSGLLLLPVLGSALALAVLPQRYRAAFGERDTWVMMLVYSITFGGFVGMSSYVSLLLTTLYGMSKIHAGLVMALLAFTGAMVRPLGGLLADRLSGVGVLLVLLLTIALANFAFAWAMPSLSGGIALLVGLYLCFGLGNGATFQLVPQRWAARTGIMTGIIGAAGGIGGFYLPVVLGLACESTGSYRPGFAVFAALAVLAFVMVAVLHNHWLTWASPGTVEVALDTPVVEREFAQQEFQSG
jgi:MFS transporter, NNP family, nitrate/nitrite transporter